MMIKDYLHAIDTDFYVFFIGFFVFLCEMGFYE